MRDPIVAIFGALLIAAVLLAWIIADYHARTGNWF